MPATLPQMVMRRYRVTANRALADGVFGLWLEAVNPSEAVPAFQAGQWVYLHLLNPDGSSWARAAYSIANAPSSGTRVIELGIKVEKDFTQRAQQLRVGDEVDVQGPWGIFTLKKDKPHIAMFAGGIGVTPLLSMLREACAMETVPRMSVFYAFRTPAEAAYLDELYALSSKYPQMTFIPICSRVSPDGWEGETGRITVDFIERHLPNGADDYIICGPDAFMDAIREIFLARGVDSKCIRRESFG